MKKIIKLTESDLRRIIKNSVKMALTERRVEDSYPEVYDDEDYVDDSYPEYYDEYYGAEDPTYTAQKNDFNGIISMLHQYGITDVEISDNDPEREYPPTLDIIIPSYMEDKKDEIISFIESRGFKQCGHYGQGEYVFNKDGYAYDFSYENTPDFQNESIIRRAVRESIKRLVETDCAGVMQTGCGNAPKGTNPEAGQYTVPLGADKETADRTPGFSVKDKAKWNKNPGNVQRRPIYNPKS